MIYVICVTEECNYVLGETACADPSSSPLPFCRFLCSSETAVNYGWTLSASCWIESEPWKAGRTVGTTCACASAYGRRDAPSPVGLCLLCLGLSGFHSVITSRESFRPWPKWTKRDLTPVTNRNFCALRHDNGFMTT